MKDAKIHFFGIVWLTLCRKSCFVGFRKYVIPVGGGVMARNLCFLKPSYKVLLLEPTFYRLTTSNLRFPCSRTCLRRKDIEGLA